MGSEQSTRRVTIDVDNSQTSSIKISSDVLQRLKEQDEIVGPVSTTTTTIPQVSAKPHFSMPPVQDSAELERLEKLYAERLKRLENLNSQLHTESKENFSQAVKEVEQKFLTQTFSPICQDKQQSVLDCYRKNPGKPILCSSEVKNFLSCVNDTRQRVLTKKG